MGHGSSQRGVIVTGGANGVGRGIVDAFAARGDHVAIWDIAGADARLAATEVNAAGGAAIAVAVDVSVPAEVTAALVETIALLGDVHVLVNNAAIHRHDDLLEMDLENWDRVIGVNTRAVFLPTQALARHWVAAGTGGAVLNISSTDSHLNFRRTTHYCASKAAVSSFTKSAALSLASHGIRVNELAPGFVDAGMAKKFIGGPEAAERLKAMVPLARAADADEVAAAAVFLTSDEARYITGARLVIDGGFSFAGLDTCTKSCICVPAIGCPSAQGRASP